MIFSDFSVEIKTLIFQTVGSLDEQAYKNNRLVCKEWLVIISSIFERLADFYQRSPLLCQVLTMTYPISFVTQKNYGTVKYLYLFMISQAQRTLACQKAKRQYLSLQEQEEYLEIEKLLALTSYFNLSLVQLEKIVEWNQAVNLVTCFSYLLKSLPEAAKFFNWLQQQPLKMVQKTRDIQNWITNNQHLLAQVKFLNFVKANLTILVFKLENFCSLTNLCLGGNQLINLLNIDRLSNLKCIELGSNGLKRIPLTICNLNNLTSLVLQHNQIQSLPKEIGCLTQLKNLYLNNNQLKCLPDEIGFLTKLECLFLEKNKLEYIPKTIGKLNQLKELDLNNNLLISLPKQICQLACLQCLSLHHNQLIYLPKKIDRLHNLRIFYLKSNRLKTLSARMTKLKKLENLYLENNPIERLPLSIFLFSNKAISQNPTVLKLKPVWLSKLTNG
jgi:Leucine-rich repeat (LRR) protein